VELEHQLPADDVVEAESSRPDEEAENVPATQWRAQVAPEQKEKRSRRNIHDERLVHDETQGRSSDILVVPLDNPRRCT